MSKKQAMWFRLYITELEHTTIDYSLLLKKSQLLETKISLLEKEKSNISEQFNLAIKTIDIQKNIIDTQEDMYTHKLKYKYRKGVKNGVIGGLVGGIIICLLIK